MLDTPTLDRIAGDVAGDPTLGGDGLRIAIDADCPACGWPERFFDTRTRRFGCIKCTYLSDERNA